MTILGRLLPYVNTAMNNKTDTPPPHCTASIDLVMMERGRQSAEGFLESLDIYCLFVLNVRGYEYLYTFL